MRKLFWFWLILFLTIAPSSFCQAPPAPLLADCLATSDPGATDLTCSITTSANHLLNYIVYGNSATCNYTMSDTFTLAWATGSNGCAAPSSGPTSLFVDIGAAKTASNSGSTTVHVHMSTGSVFFLEAWDAGLSKTSVNDGGNHGAGTGGPGTITTGTLTTSVASDLIAAIGVSSTCTAVLSAGTGYTAVRQHRDSSGTCVTTEIKVSGSAGSYTASFVQDASSTWWMNLADAFQFSPLVTGRPHSTIIRFRRHGQRRITKSLVTYSQ